MHLPYDSFDKAIIQFDKIKGYSKDYLVYLQKANYTDHYIGKFLDYLKKMNLYDNSLIIITSDHACPIKFSEEKDSYCPLFIINAGTDINNHKVIGQIDVYPTILDLMGIKTDKWRGIGYSIFTPDSIKQIDYNTQKDISDLIIRSNALSNISY